MRGFSSSGPFSQKFPKKDVISNFESECHRLAVKQIDVRFTFPPTQAAQAGSNSPAQDPPVNDSRGYPTVPGRTPKPAPPASDAEILAAADVWERGALQPAASRARPLDARRVCVGPTCQGGSREPD
jgi:hypothetical protein